MIVTGTSSAEKIVAYSMPMTPAPTTVRLRGTCGSVAMLSLSKTFRSLNGMSGGRNGAVPTAMMILSPVKLCSSELVFTTSRCGSTKRATPAKVLHAVAGELVLQHFDLVVERHPQPDAEVLALDVLLHPVGEPVEAALAPAGKVEHRLAQRLGRDRAGMHRDAADPQPVLDDEHASPELGRLDRGAPPRRPAADDDKIVLFHRRPALLPCAAKIHGGM